MIDYFVFCFLQNKNRHCGVQCARLCLMCSKSIYGNQIEDDWMRRKTITDTRPTEWNIKIRGPPQSLHCSYFSCEQRIFVFCFFFVCAFPSHIFLVFCCGFFTRTFVCSSESQLQIVAFYDARARCQNIRQWTWYVRLIDNIANWKHFHKITRAHKTNEKENRISLLVVGWRALQVHDTSSLTARGAFTKCVTNLYVLLLLLWYEIVHGKNRKEKKKKQIVRNGQHELNKSIFCATQFDVVLWCAVFNWSCGNSNCCAIPFVFFSSI